MRSGHLKRGAWLLRIALFSRRSMHFIVSLLAWCALPVNYTHKSPGRCRIACPSPDLSQPVQEARFGEGEHAHSSCGSLTAAAAPPDWTTTDA